MTSKREKELKESIASDQVELAVLKGSTVIICGLHYHRWGSPETACTNQSKDIMEHQKYFPNCQSPAPLKLYQRGVIFDEDGEASIDWDLQ